MRLSLCQQPGVPLYVGGVITMSVSARFVHNIVRFPRGIAPPQKPAPPLQMRPDDDYCIRAVCTLKTNNGKEVEDFVSCGKTLDVIQRVEVACENCRDGCPRSECTKARITFTVANKCQSCRGQVYRVKRIDSDDQA